MKIRSQVGMVLNLDKCIGCHTCSVTCKNVWTSRGMESTRGSTTLKVNRASVSRTTGRIRKSGRAAGSVRSEAAAAHGQPRDAAG
jgi:Fe-S-cluster-containing dehydrogenase component